MEINSNEVLFKVIEDTSYSSFERDVNRWLNSNDVVILKIECKTASLNENLFIYNAFITYRMK